MRRVTGFVLSRVDNQVHHFERPPRAMQIFFIDVGIHCPILVDAREAHRPTSATGTHNYFIFGYIVNL
jgi:hypothetical protein